MSRRLIVNADDCNLTPGVTQVILECHQSGIVTSTTFLINLPINTSVINKIKRNKKLGVGLHLNVTLGQPVLPNRSVANLLQSNGQFKKMSSARRLTAKTNKQIVAEYEAQVLKFKRVFRRWPTHLDSHHHLHDRADCFRSLFYVAKKFRLPIRRSRALGQKAFPSTDYFFGSLNPKRHWKRAQLERTLTDLPEGTSEIMCHPGINDRDLKRISSFQTGRTTERRIFRCKGLRQFVEKKGIKLIHYGMI